MKRRLMIALGVALLLAAGAALWMWAGPEDEASPLPARVVGFRYRTADATPVFDRGVLPVLWVPPGGPVAVEWHRGDVIAAQVETEAVTDGRIVRVLGWPSEPPLGGGALTVRVDGKSARWTARWQIPPDELPQVAAVAAHRAAGEFEQARRLLDETGDSVKSRLWLGVERARLAQMTGDSSAAIEAWLEAATSAARLGIVTEERRRLRSAAFMAWQARKASQMTSILDRAARLDDPQSDPWGHARLLCLQGQLSLLLGDWRGARAAFEDARSRARRFGDHSTAWTATEGVASLLDTLGEPRMAAERLKALEVEQPTPAPAARMRLAVNLGWLTLRALPQSPTAAQRAELRERLDAGRDAAERMDDRLEAANAAVNQAWGAIELGDLDTAEARLAEARALDPAGDGYAAPYETLLQARVDLARGRYDAAEAGFLKVENRAFWEQGEVSELGWRAKLGRARVARARSDGHAPYLYQRAIEIVDALGRRASLRGDRATFHADRSELIDEAIELAIHDQPERAFGYADAARARPMRALQANLRVSALDPDARRRWAEAIDAAQAAAEASRAVYARLKVAPVAETEAVRQEALAADKAREAAFDAAFAVLDRDAPDTVPAGIDGSTVSRLLAPDEVLFGFHGRWAFRVDNRGTTARPMPEGDPLGDWRALPDAIRHVYIVPGGQPDAFRLATAGDTPLLARASVSFLPYAGLLLRPAKPADGAPLVVADPRGDLAFAAAEGAAVAQALPGARLLTGSAAARGPVLAALADAAVFHFAGHGVLHPERPWDAHLRLAGSDDLSLTDVLTHPLGAGLVVLSGCETGVDAVLLDEAVVGLPEAFLAAGARSVLATDREVDDRATRRFVERFYAAGGAERPAEALRIAALAARDANDPAWSAFRLIGLRARP